MRIKNVCFINLHFLRFQDIIVDENEVVKVSVPKFVTELKDLLSTVDNRVVANYMMWRYVKSVVSFLDRGAQDIGLNYSKVLYGQSKAPPRWETCVSVTAQANYFKERSLTKAVGSMYAQNYFPEYKKDQADEMVVNIRNEFKIMLDELEWMDDATKASAQAKVDQMTPHIGYSKEILDTDLMNELYKELSLTSGSYLTNTLQLQRFVNAYDSKEFRQAIDKHSWKTHGGAAMAGAFYHEIENSIQFPAGVFDGLFFQADRPAYMNYGAIGMIIGHEITHGFDDQGSQRDGEGNVY